MPFLPPSMNVTCCGLPLAASFLFLLSALAVRARAHPQAGGRLRGNDERGARELDGLGCSTHSGDFAAFFLTLGAGILQVRQTGMCVAHGA
ncbi:MAG: hypothetical protein N3C12_05160 [Candidatus Binatia bacterium]|nr:hypothetical protein [Candidatus Binatia bacterium]